jgi:hypothetical protein
MNRGLTKIIVFALGFLMTSTAYATVIRLYYKDAQTGRWGCIQFNTDTCEITDDHCCYSSANDCPAMPVAHGGNMAMPHVSQDASRVRQARPEEFTTWTKPASGTQKTVQVAQPAHTMAVTDAMAADLEAALKSVRARLQSHSYKDIGQLRKIVGALDDTSLLLLTKGASGEEALLLKRLALVETRLSSVQNARPQRDLNPPQ